MEWMDRERNFWLVGGDKRQQALAKLLEEEGHTVHVTALEGEGLTPEPLGPGLALAHCVILPLPVTRGEGLIHSPLSEAQLSLEELLQALTPGQILCGGLVSPAERRQANDHGLRLYDYYAREECMVANAVPPAAAVGPTSRPSCQTAAGDVLTKGWSRHTISLFLCGTCPARGAPGRRWRCTGLVPLPALRMGGSTVNILVLNASPKGDQSTTVHTARYLQALHPEHTFTFVPVGQRIRSYEKNFAPLRAALEQAELLLFCYPVYTFIAPYQLHRLMELIKADGVDLTGKFASQITTSKHFYDVTAHRYVEENCFDLGLRVVRGLSADMDDLLTEQGQREARDFFDQLLFSCAHGWFATPPVKAPQREKTVYQPVLSTVPKSREKDVVIVTNYAPDDANLQNMIADFQAALPYESRVVNLREFPFSGGCLGCFCCAVEGKCVHKDGFDTFLRIQIQCADAFVYAFTIADHYTHSSFKCFDDRQFCNGHRTVTHGTPIAYLISGDYRYESNLRMILEGRSEVGGNYLCGVATDEQDTAADIQTLADSLVFALARKLSRPANFYGVGGMKIFRDLIYLMQGLMKADHKFYKAHGIYDFPQKQRKRILQMKLVGAMLSLPSMQRKMRSQMNRYIVAPYEKVIQQAQEKRP